MLTASSFHSGHRFLHEAAWEESGSDEARGEHLGGGEHLAHQQHGGQRPTQPRGELWQRGAGAALRDLTQSEMRDLVLISRMMLNCTWNSKC